jgi:hypothetical protein
MKVRAPEWNNRKKLRVVVLWIPALQPSDSPYLTIYKKTL